MTFGECDDSITNNIYLSLKIKKGYWFHNAEFGSRLYLIKNTKDSSLKDAQNYSREAVQWMFDTGKIKSFSSFFERDKDVEGRINIAITCVAGDNRTINYSTFYMVGN